LLYLIRYITIEIHHNRKNSYKQGYLTNSHAVPTPQTEILQSFSTQMDYKSTKTPGEGKKQPRSCNFGADRPKVFSVKNTGGKKTLFT